MNEKVSHYFGKYPQWRNILNRLRDMLLDCGLAEDFKWSFPVYLWEGKNLFGLGAAKEYAGIWFFQGGLLKDEGGLLTNAREGKTKAMRQWRFSHHDQMNQALIRTYILESIDYQKAGVEIKPDREKEIVLPEILQKTLLENPELASVFEKLPRGKKRDFAEYISAAKMENTRLNRLEKCIPMILSGTGINDKYK